MNLVDLLQDIPGTNERPLGMHIPLRIVSKMASTFQFVLSNYEYTVRRSTLADVRQLRLDSGPRMLKKDLETFRSRNTPRTPLSRVERKSDVQYSRLVFLGTNPGKSLDRGKSL